MFILAEMLAKGLEILLVNIQLVDHRCIGHVNIQLVHYIIIDASVSLTG